MHKQENAPSHNESGATRRRKEESAHYEALLPPALENVERVPFHIEVRSRGGKGCGRTKVALDYGRIDKASYTPEGRIAK